MATTQTTDLFVPEVIDSEIKDGVKNNSIFTPTATVDFSLEGKPGNTITFLKYGSIGGADIVGENDVLVPAKLTQNATPVTIEELAKAVEVSYKAEIQGQGSAVDQAIKQIKDVIAMGVDKKLYNTYLTNPVHVLNAYSNATDKKMGFKNIVLATSMLDIEDGSDIFLYIHPDQVLDVITDPAFVDAAKYTKSETNPKLNAAEVGSIHGVRIIKTRNITKDVTDGFYNNILIVKGAGQIRFQKQAEVKSAEDILARKYILAASSLVASATVDDSKLVVIKAL